MSNENTVNSATCANMNEFIAQVESNDFERPANTIRQQIIREYPRLRQLMKEKRLTRAMLYQQFKQHFKQVDDDGNDISITEKTFFNYLAAGKVEMDNKKKQQK